MAVMVTACSRPDYLRRTLESWGAARNISEISDFVIALGRSDRSGEQIDVAAQLSNYTGFGIRILEDSEAAAASHGMHRAVAEGITEVFDEPSVQFVVAGEEDVVVSDDVLEYMNWACWRFRNHPAVLAVLAHDVGGTGWDSPADPNSRHDELVSAHRVRLRHYFNPWVWGTWRDRWEKILLPRWEYCEPPRWGTGYDWNIATRIVPGEYLCVVPDASRSQNIGEHGGVYSSPDIFAGQQTSTFAYHRDPVTYMLGAQP